MKKTKIKNFIFTASTFLIAAVPMLMASDSFCWFGEEKFPNKEDYEK